HVRQGLQIGFVLGQFLGRAVQKPDMRVGSLDDLAVELEYKPQHAVRGRMLGTKVECVVLDFSHVLAPRSVAFLAYDPGSEFARLDGDRLVDDSLLFSVVSHFNVAGEGKIFTEGMPYESVVGEDTTEVGVAFENDAVQVEGLALEPVDRGPDIDKRGQHRKLVIEHVSPDPQAPVVLDGQKMHHYCKTLW